MNLTLDFNWDSSFLYDSSPESAVNCYPVAPRHYYNDSASSTFYRPFFNWIFSGYKIRYPYGGDCNANEDSWGGGNIAQDTWKIGTQSVSSVTFVYSQNYSSMLSNNWSSDGILGFLNGDWGDYVSTPCGVDYDDRCNSAVQSLLAPYDDNVVSLYLQRPASLVTTAIPSGSLTLGGSDSEHCSGWTSLDQCTEFYFAWSATIDRVTLSGSVLSKKWQAAIFDPTSEFIYTTSYEDIARKLNAEYDFASDSYVVQCEAAKSFADIIFTLGGKDYHLPATDYARQTAANAGKKTCTLMFLNFQTWDSTWTLGTTFLRAFCLALDFDSGSVSVAKAL